MVYATTRRDEDGEEQPAQACAAPEEKDLANEKMAPSEGRTVRGRRRRHIPHAPSCVRTAYTPDSGTVAWPPQASSVPRESPLFRCTYELGPVIGKGNDGQVMRAVNLETGKRVAIKIMRRRCNPDDDMSEVTRGARSLTTH
jgi:hypothetical protein